MKQKDKLKFKLNSLHRKTQACDNRYLHNQDIPIRSDRVRKNFDSMYEKVEHALKEQNNKISFLESQYQETMLQKFDKLISINQRIAKNFDKFMKKFQKEEQNVKSEIFLPPLAVEPKGAVTMKAMTSRKIIKPKIEHKRIESVSPKKIQQSQPNIQTGWDSKVQQKKNQERQLQQMAPFVNVILQNYKMQHPVEERQDKQTKHQQICLTRVFQTIVDFKCSETSISKQLNKYIGTFYSNTSQKYFQEYSSGKIKYEDMKVKFSTDIINSVIQLCEKWMEFLVLKKLNVNLDECLVRGRDFYRLFNQASKKSLQYLIHKYPPSRTKQIDTQLSQKIKQIRSYSAIKYDLLKNAKMEFGFIKDQKDFSVEIKRWLNALIKQSKKQYPIFKQTMKSIFTNNEGSLDGSKTQNEIQYQIGAKIPQNAQLYTQDQIQAPGLPIKNPQILRILVKWFQQLYSYFSNTQQKIVNNKYGFKTDKHRSIAIRIPNSRLQILTEKLKKICEQSFQPFRKDQLTNIGSVIDSLIAISFSGIQGHQFINSKQATITKLSQCMYETFKSYILIFLNGIMQNLIKIRSQYQPNTSQSVINLITFNVTDLLRCKCIGTKQEILRIYNQIVSNTNYFEVIRVKNKLNEPTRDILINLKLKNSFLICEVQLSLGKLQEQVNYHFCHYLYELERSGFGVLFQCASQIANLDPKISYMKKQKALKFKKNLILSERCISAIRFDKAIYCKLMHQQKKMKPVPSTQPYCCLICNSYIQSNRNRLPHLKCSGCGISICTQCIGQFSLNNPQLTAELFQNQGLPEKLPEKLPNEFFKKRFKYLGVYEHKKVKTQIQKELLTCEYVILCAVDQTHFHRAIFKKYKSSIAQSFSTIQEIRQFNIDQNQGRPLCCIISLQKPILKKISELQGFMKFHVSLSWWQLKEILDSRNITEVICVEVKEIKSVLILDIVQTQQQINEVMSKKRVDRTILNLNKSQGNYLQITSKNLHSLDFLANIQNKKNLTTLNLWENKIADISLISQFTNLQQLFLPQNKVRSIDAILPLHKLRLLVIGENEITGKLPALKMPNNQIVVFVKNKINDISDFSLSELPNLILLNFCHNQIQSLPQFNFPKLQHFKIFNSKVSNITEFLKSILPSLQGLMLNNNNLCGILQPFNFPQLLYLNLSNNRINSLSEFTQSHLPKLKHLNLNQNQIKGCLKQFCMLQLEQLYISHNKITSISQTFFSEQNLPKIRIVNLRDNKIKNQLPQFKFKSLKKLDLGENNISDVESFEKSAFDSIEQLLLDHNEIVSFAPKSHFRQLKIIDMSFNQIKYLDLFSCWKAPKVQDIRLNNNKIVSKIPTIQLYCLKRLDISNNLIQDQIHLQNMHLTPKIVSINICGNPKRLKQQILRKFKNNRDVMKHLEL